VETSPGGCDDFRADCRAAGGGTTSTGNPLVSIINCVAIPPIPQEAADAPGASVVAADPAG
jgi:hypothetical protein